MARGDVTDGLERMDQLGCIHERMAGGCTSGHGISGTMQLSVGSWVAVVCFFAGGIATAMLMFRV